MGLGKSHKQLLFCRGLFRNPSHKIVFAKDYTAAVFQAEWNPADELLNKISFQFMQMLAHNLYPLSASPSTTKVFLVLNVIRITFVSPVLTVRLFWSSSSKASRSATFLGRGNTFRGKAQLKFQHAAFSLGAQILPLWSLSTLVTSDTISFVTNLVKAEILKAIYENKQVPPSPMTPVAHILRTETSYQSSCS